MTSVFMTERVYVAFQNNHDNIFQSEIYLQQIITGEYS